MSRTWKQYFSSTFAIIIAAVVGIVVSIALYFGGHAVANSRLFLVKEVHISGNIRVSEADLYLATGLDQARNILTCDEEEMRLSIEAMPWIKSATVVFSSGNVITIDIEETSLRGMVIADQAYLLDEDLHLVRPWLASDGLITPIFVGVTLDSPDGLMIMEDTINEAENLIELFETNALGETLDVQEVHHDALFGYSLVLSDGAEIRLAHDRAEARFQRVEEIYQQLQMDQLTPSVILVNGASIAQVAVRLSQENH